MSAVETNTRKIVARLEQEGWVNIGGGKHDRFAHGERQGARIVVRIVSNRLVLRGK